MPPEEVVLREQRPSTVPVPAAAVVEARLRVTRQLDVVAGRAGRPPECSAAP